MIDINAVFDRICEAKGIKTDLALAEFLGVSKSAVNQSRAKGTANLWTLIERCQGMDLNWILKGERQAAGVTFESAMEYLASLGYKVTIQK